MKFDHDPEIELLIPSADEQSPELSIVVPALNEQLTIADFIDWCHEGINQAQVKAEILIIDSSKDDTAKIAVAKGARVLKTPKRGLGRAYIDALPFIRGKYIVMGDCDCTYDFRHLKPFVEKFREGNEYIMGSRFIGTIESGAMPPLHQYIGTPVTTWILNVIYSSKFSDIHCGMRGISKSALEQMKIESQSWEYASEMVLKSVHMELQTAEVPIHFYKDREGRLSHHRRSGWFSPWQAAWINLKAMFIYGADFFLFKPGLVLLFLGLLLLIPLSFGNFSFSGINFSRNWMLLSLLLSVLGMQLSYMGIIARVILDFTGKKTKFWFSKFDYNKSCIISLLLAITGIGFFMPLVSSYIDSGFGQLNPLNITANRAVTGLFFVIAAFTHFSSMLVLHALVKRKKSTHV